MEVNLQINLGEVKTENNSKITTPRHIIIKLLKIKDEILLKAA
jgi:hypothetical protein